MTDQPTNPVPEPTPAKPAPAQPVPASAGSAAAPIGTTPISRRKFFSTLTLGWVGFAGATGVFASTMVRYLFPNVNYEPPSSFKAGMPGDYAVGEVDERWKEKYGVWIVRNEKILFALSTVCTHLGCTPNWLAAEDKYKCPCHGSGFHRDGINFEGPAPRPLERYRVVLDEDGEILVDKSRKYQYEKGQWKDPESFIKLGSA